MLIKKCSRHEVQDIKPWSKWQLHATLRSWISKQIPIYSYFSKTSPSTPSFAYFSLATAWRNVAAKYAKGRLNRGREAWKLSSLPCSEVAASQGPSITISMELFPLLCAMHCWYNFQIDLSKDSNLFWNYRGLCHFSTDLRSCLQVHAIKKPSNKVEGSSESNEILIRTGVWALCCWRQVRSDCSSPGALITLQLSNRKWTSLTLLLFSLSSSSPLLRSRGGFAATQNEKTSQTQMHLIFQEGLDSACTCTLKQSSWTSDVSQNTKADLFYHFLLT